MWQKINPWTDTEICDESFIVDKRPLWIANHLEENNHIFSTLKYYVMPA